MLVFWAEGQGGVVGAGHALLVGISEFGGPIPDGEEVPVEDTGLGELVFVRSVVPPVGAALQRLGYATDQRWDLVAWDLRNAVAETIGSPHGPARVVYVASHGLRGTVDGRVDVVPSCMTVGVGTSASQWVEDAQQTGVPTLFLFDLCHAGRAAQALVHRVDGQLNAWVMAACSGGQQAFDGRFSAALAEVLEQVAVDGLGTDPALPYVRFSEVARRVTQRVRQTSAIVQDVACSAMDLGMEEPELPFFRNPSHGRDVAALPRIAPDLQGFLDPSDAQHFRDKAGARFTGRRTELRDLAPWLDDTQVGGLRVVTGAPGAGKSALLGALVCAAHPELANAVPQVRARLSATDPGLCPSVNDHLAAVHARGRTTDEVLAGIARQLQLPARPEPLPTSALAEQLVGLPQIPAVVVDAVDEAADPVGLCAALARLASARRPEGHHVARLLVGARPWPIFAPLWDLAADDGRLFDLDDVDPAQLRGDLSAHIATFLGDLPQYQPPQLRPVREALARATATRLVPSTSDGTSEGTRRMEWGAYLVATVFTRYLTTQPAPTDTHAATLLGASAPDKLPEVLDMDLGARTDGDNVRAVLAALALARGDGMPPEIVLPLVGLFAPELDTERGLLDKALFYLRTTPDMHGILHYRLFHQGLADHLTHHPTRQPDSHTPTPSAVFDHLLTTHAPTMEGYRQWDSAPGYLLRYAPDHARAAGRLDNLLTDPEFLCHADPSTVAAAFLAAGSASAVRARTIYTASIARHRNADVQTRRQLLALDACRSQEVDLSTALARELPWRPEWSVGTTLHPSLLDTLTGHHGPVDTIACAVVDSTPVAVTGGRDGTVRLWDLAARRPLATFAGHRRGVNAVACAVVDGTPVAVTGGDDGTVRLWDLAARRPLATSLARHQDAVWAVACAVVDGTPLAVTGGEGRVSLWDLASRQPIAALPVHGLLGAASTVLDGTPIAVVAICDAGLGLLDLAARRPLATLTGHRRGAGVKAVACAVVDSTPVAVTGGRDGTVRLWDLAARRPLATFAGHRRGVNAVACAVVDGTPVAVTGGDDGTVRLWDLAARRPLATSLARHQDAVWAVACTVIDGTPVVVTGSHDKTVRVWDLAARRRFGAPLMGHHDAVLAVACAVVDGRPVAVTGGDDNTVRVWDLATRRPLGVLTGHRDAVLAVACTIIDGRLVAVTGSDDKTVRLWDLSRRRALGMPLIGHDDRVNTVACTVIGGTPIAVTGGDDNTVRVWDLVTRRPLGVLTGHHDAVWAVACSVVDGTPVAVTSSRDGTVRVWDLTTRRPFGAPLAGHNDLVRALTCASIDGTPVAVTGSDDKSVRIWDLGNRTSTAYTLHDPVDALAFDGSQRLVAACGGDLVVLRVSPSPFTNRVRAAGQSATAVPGPLPDGQQLPDGKPFAASSPLQLSPHLRRRDPVADIVGVHGVWNYRRRESPQQAADALSSAWEGALAAGLARDYSEVPAPRIRVAYYGDLLRRPGRQGADDDLDSLAMEEDRFAQGWLSALDLPDGAPAGWSTREVRQAVETLAEMRGLGKSAVKWFVAGLFREVPAYMRDPVGTTRASVCHRVAEAITESGARIVVAHSLGSVVAYETLWEYPDMEVDLLVTLGSPLALPHEVFPLLQPAPRDGRGARPPGVRRWVNFADTGDIVAVPMNGVETYFDGVEVDPDKDPIIGAFSFHQVGKYLEHRRIAAAIAQALRP